MRILMLGGTKFVGRNIVEAALSRGHEVTLFNRGNRTDVFPELELLVGNRDGKLEALQGRTWDAVIDTSGYVPRIVNQSLQALVGSTGHYTFISTLDVYDEPYQEGIDESHPVVPLVDEKEESIEVAYGALKARCEQLVRAAMPDRSLIVRCGLVAGPGDHTDRFTYWPARISRGGEVLAPGDPNAPIQFIDVRDLAAWIVRMIEAQESGTYNGTGPAEPVTLGRLLETCVHTLNPDARLIWVSDAFLQEHEVGSWIEMPLWLPSGKNLHALMTLRVDRAVAKGFIHRPLADTIRDIHAWDAARAADEPRKAGLTPEREQSLLEQWRRQPQLQG